MTSTPKWARTIAAILFAIMMLALALSALHVLDSHVAGSFAFFAFYGLIALILFVLIFTWFYSTDARQLKAAWGSFPELPGEHLRWHQTARGMSQIVARDGRVLATIEGLGLLLHPWIVQVLGFWAPSLPPRPPRCVKVGQETYLIGGWQENARVTGPDGMAALLFTERNFDHQARAVAYMPNGQTLRFPVQGTTRRNAVMTATDNSDLPVFRIRRVRSTGPGPERKNRIEIVVEQAAR